MLNVSDMAVSSLPILCAKHIILITFWQCDESFNSIRGPAALEIKKVARDTLALPAKGAALCTPVEGRCPCAPGKGRYPLHSQVRVDEEMYLIGFEVDRIPM